ncbi:MAG TPA: HAD-IA family hydrolase [Steroidobacteraceae bacterium]|nr:HAD-IA family hydrolase [Steroidobacteraceae bacterium]
MLKALLWDVDGTLAETERDGHLVAFNAAFEEFGLPWRWSEERYAELLRVAGGFERLLHFLESEPRGSSSKDERRTLARRLHLRKNELYVGRVEEGAVPLRPGVRELMDDCARAGVFMAIVTTTSRGNAEALLRVNLGGDWQRRFAALVGAEDAPRKKPDPQAYRVALELLGLEAHEAVAIEDSPAGLESALAAGVPVVMARSRFFADAPVNGAIAAGPGLERAAGWEPAPSETSGRIGLAQIRAWHRLGSSTSPVRGRGRA